MQYAKVVLGLPVEGPFDYAIPDELSGCVKAGSRVLVNFRNKKEVAYVVYICGHSDVPRIKQLMGTLDGNPSIPEILLALAKRISSYYCCSLGEAIELMLPDRLRKGCKISVRGNESRIKKEPALPSLQDIQFAVSSTSFFSSIRGSTPARPARSFFDPSIKFLSGTMTITDIPASMVFFM